MEADQKFHFERKKLFLLTKKKLSPAEKRVKT